jgi:hypothetical protein
VRRCVPRGNPSHRTDEWISPWSSIQYTHTSWYDLARQSVASVRQRSLSLRRPSERHVTRCCPAGRGRLRPSAPKGRETRRGAARRHHHAYGLLLPLDTRGRRLRAGAGATSPYHDLFFPDPAPPRVLPGPALVRASARLAKTTLRNCRSSSPTKASHIQYSNIQMIQTDKDGATRKNSPVFVAVISQYWPCLDTPAGLRVRASF